MVASIQEDLQMPADAQPPEPVRRKCKQRSWESAQHARAGKILKQTQERLVAAQTREKQLLDVVSAVAPHYHRCQHISRGQAQEAGRFALRGVGGESTLVLAEP